jgi:hypothetical protein
MSSRLATPFRKLTFLGALGLVPLGASCAASPPPATPPAPAPTIASTPSASTTLPIATTPSGTAPGDACSPEGATQNADACQKTGGMCAFSTCENGHWAWHEVPPRPNPSTGPTAQPTIPGFPSSAAPADLADGSKPFSIAMWIKPTKSGGTLAHVSSNADGTGWCIPFLGYDDSGRIVSQVFHGSGPAPTEFSVAGAAAPAVGAWSHVAMTWAAGGSNRLYVNGVEVAATAAPTYNASGAGTRLVVTWGSSSTNGASYCWQGAVHAGDFQGAVQGTTVVNKALTRAEVGALAKARP